VSRDGRLSGSRLGPRLESARFAWFEQGEQAQQLSAEGLAPPGIGKVRVPLRPVTTAPAPEPFRAAAGQSGRGEQVLRLLAMGLAPPGIDKARVSEWSAIPPGVSPLHCPVRLPLVKQCRESEVSRGWQVPDRRIMPSPRALLKQRQLQQVGHQGTRSPSRTPDACAAFEQIVAVYVRVCVCVATGSWSM